MRTEIIHSRRELAIKMVKFVYGDLDNVDTCKIRGAFLLFLPVLLFKTLKFVFWDFWTKLLDISEGLFGFALGFTVASLLAGLCIGLYIADPAALVTFGKVIGIVMGYALVIGVTATVLCLLDDYSKSPEGERTLEGFRQGVEYRFHQAADSLPGKIFGWILKIVFFPIKLVFYHFIWQFVCRKDKENLGMLGVGLALVTIIGGAVTGLVFLFLFSAFVGLLLLSSIAGLFVVGVPTVWGVKAFAESGTKDALIEGFVDFKNYVCRPVKVVD